MDSTPRPAAPPRFEPEAAIVRLGGRPDFLRQVVARFIELGPRLVAEAEAATPQSPELARRALHSLAGSGATCGAAALAQAAGALSHAAAAGRMDEVAGGLAVLAEEMRAYAADATRWLAQGT